MAVGRPITMAIAAAAAHPPIFCSALSPLSISQQQQQLRLSDPANVHRVLLSRSGITSCDRSSCPRALVGPFVLSRRRPSGNWWCIGSVSRRGFVVGSVPISWIAVGVVAVAGSGALASAAMAGQGGRQRAMVATRQGMQLFSQGDVKGSLEKFDEALELDTQSLPCAVFTRSMAAGALLILCGPPLASILSVLDLVSRFEEGAKQFRDDVAVNPNDTEEAIWCFLCEAQFLGVDIARKDFLMVGPDRRPIMKEIYNLFRYGGSTDVLLQAVHSSEGADYFYANLYIGLYHEAHKREGAAKEAILAATQSLYGTRSGDYMAILARVHAKCRGWKTSIAPFA